MCKILLFLALLPVIALAESDIISEFAIDPCMNQLEGVFISNPRGCAWFNRCAERKSIEGRCPPDLIFNAAKSLCDYPENVECDLDDRVIDTTCTGSGIKFLPSLYSCSKYTICFDG